MEKRKKRPTTIRQRCPDRPSMMAMVLRGAQRCVVESTKPGCRQRGFFRVTPNRTAQETSETSERKRDLTTVFDTDKRAKRVRNERVLEMGGRVCRPEAVQQAERRKASHKRDRHTKEQSPLLVFLQPISNRWISVEYKLHIWHRHIHPAQPER